MLLGAGVIGIATAGAALIGGYELVEAGVLPGRIRLDQMLGRNPAAPPIPSTAPGPLEEGSFYSAARGCRVWWSIAYPPGFKAGDRLPVCVALHGRYENNEFPFVKLHLDRFLAAAVSDGVRPFAIASIDGGSATNWHPRASGDNPQAMVTYEFLPMLARRGLSTDRIALWGWSLGGYGVLLLASSL